MNKILKITTLSLPMLALAPLVSLSTTNNTSAVSRTMSGEIDPPVGTSYDWDVSDKATAWGDTLAGSFHLVVTKWNSKTMECDVTLKITRDDGADHDNKFPTWDNAFHMVCDKGTNKIESGNKKAYFSLDVYAWGQNEVFASWDVRSAYSVFPNHGIEILN